MSVLITSMLSMVILISLLVELGGPLMNPDWNILILSAVTIDIQRALQIRFKCSVLEIRCFYGCKNRHLSFCKLLPRI